jgi:large subunit ribosomal protein L25
MNTIKINGNLRESQGKKSAKYDRRNGVIPCVLYGGKENMHFTVTEKEVKALVYTTTLNKASIKLNDKDFDAIIKDIQFHPVNDAISHIDFLELVDGQLLTTSIPVEIKGNAKGVKNGGKLRVKMRQLAVKCLPKHLISSILINVKKLKIGESTRVNDLEYEGINFTDPLSNPIVSVVKTRVYVEEEDEDDETTGTTTEAGTEGSKEGEGKEAPAEATEQKA